jgi:Uncharacterized protein conserved in bacteria (DUF2252)
MTSTAGVEQPTNPTLQERIDQGAAARARTPLARHANFAPVAGRDALTILELQATSRIPELVPVRYGRMLVSPFTFFRGAAAVMAADLAATPRSGLVTQLCGDAHLSNFGLFASAERHLVFDLNDFDETLPGPWEWDVKRLAASLVVASRGNGHARKAQRDIARGSVERYRATMHDFAGQDHLSAWYAHLDIDESAQRLLRPLSKPDRAAVSAVVAKSRRHTSTQATQKLTTVDGGTRRFVTAPLLIEPARSLQATGDGGALQRDVHEVLGRYRRSLPSNVAVLLDRFDVVDIARKVVGVGSVGTRCYVVLLRGRDEYDWLIMQVKEAQRSVLANSRAHGTLPTFRKQGQRVVEGQRLMQATSDIFLGWVTAQDIAGGGRRDFYVRQLRDWKESAPVEVMSPKDLRRYGELCAWTLARAHARGGDRVAIASYLGDEDTFARAVADFAASYADQTERDHAALATAVTEGRIAASTE